MNFPLRGPLLLRLALFAAVPCLALRAEDPRVVDLATRAAVRTGGEIMISGFTIGPGDNKTVLLRAVGPTLANFGVTGFLADPTLTLYRGSTVLATNDNWLAADAATMTSVGAFALNAASKDAALVTTLAPGSYTAQVSGVGATTGIALVEVYEVGATATSSRLINLSTRAYVGTGGSVMIPGLVLSGTSGTRTLLIRAAGPALTALSVSGALADPTLTVTNSAGTVTYATNDNWSTPTPGSAASAALLAGAFTSAGAFSFTSGSADAAVLVDLAPGSYTVQVSGVSSTSGVALVEVYDLTGVSITLAATTATGSYLATAGNGDGIPSPLATTTYAVTDGGKTIQVPETMVYVPAGSFTMGTGTTATTATTTAYCIGKFEVTNIEWKTYLDAIGSKSYPAHWTNGTYPAGKANHPVLYVSLTSAQAYCAWVSQKTGWTVAIPSAEQWEKAARGPNAYLYPWGNTLDAAYNATTGVLTTKCNYNGVVAAYYLFNSPNLAVTYDNKNSPYYGTTTTVSKIAGYDTTGAATLFALSSSGGVNGWVNHDTYTGFIYTDLFSSINAVGGTTTPVGTYLAGKSAYGCYDMAGNVWEWTTSLITATNGAEAGVVSNEIRGGSWYATSNSCRVIGIGEGRSASGNFNTVGFRVVMTLP